MRPHTVSRQLQSFPGTAQVLTVSTSSGQLISFLAALPTVYGAHGGRLAHLTSLSEVSVVDVLSSSPASKLEVACEPAFCAVGPEHIAVGMNNQVCSSGGGSRGIAPACWRRLRLQPCRWLLVV